MEGTNNFNGGSNFHSSNQGIHKSFELGQVVSITDDEGLDRIKVSINGSATSGGDNGVAVKDLPWCSPMLPKFFTSKPKVGETVYVMSFTNQRNFADRLYIGPLISQNQKLQYDAKSITGLGTFKFSTIAPNVDIRRIPEIRGVFANDDDIALQGRYNTDLIFKKNEVLLRAGKFLETVPTETNPYPFAFNNKTQSYIQLKNDVTLKKATNETSAEKGTVVNIVGNKINLLTHKDASPVFNLTNQDNLISDDELSKILDTAHPLPFGDVVIEYLRLMKNALLSHVHNGDGRPPTDLTIGDTLPVSEFMKNADALEKVMLSKNVRIN